jgi:hypothetical protein
MGCSLAAHQTSDAVQHDVHACAMPSSCGHLTPAQLSHGSLQIDEGSAHLRIARATTLFAAMQGVASGDPFAKCALTAC